MTDIEQAVQTITADLPIILGGTTSSISFKYNSGYHSRWVTYLGFNIWSDDNDCRKFSRKLGTYEPIEGYLRRRINQINAKLGKLRVGRC